MAVEHPAERQQGIQGTTMTEQAEQFYPEAPTRNVTSDTVERLLAKRKYDSEPASQEQPRTNALADVAGNVPSEGARSRIPYAGHH